MHETHLKVLTLNIHKGFSMGQRRFTLERIRQCLRDSQAGIVFLQEVVGEHSVLAEKIPDWPQMNQMEYLADSVWSHHAYGKNAIYQKGHHGNAILSEVPFRAWHNLDVSMMSFSQRGMLHGVTGNNLHLLCVHLGLFEGERRRQIQKLVDYIKHSIPERDPLVLAGDFNDWRSSGHRQLVKALGLREAFQQHNDRLALTFPAIKPMVPVDRIYVRGLDVKGCEIMSGPEWRNLSDHCALVAELSH